MLAVLVGGLEREPEVVVVANQCRQPQQDEGAEENDEWRHGQSLESFSVAFVRVHGVLLAELSPSALNVSTGHVDGEDCVNPEQIDEPPEVEVVAFADAVGYEGTVVIKHFDAHVARPTVDGSLRPHDHAREAKLEPRHKSFLSL